jgi:hypothetical protein
LKQAERERYIARSPFDRTKFRRVPPDDCTSVGTRFNSNRTEVRTGDGPESARCGEEIGSTAEVRNERHRNS